jgi:multicomponent Na+:H+ antiporter subunit G
MEVARELIAWVLLVGGAVFAVIGGIGLLRLPDFFTRMHAGGVTDTLGAGMILIGLMTQSGFSLVTVKIMAVLFFLLVTSPTSTHALAKSALSHGIKPWTRRPEDEPSHN